jgi:plasmid stability protein
MASLQIRDMPDYLYESLKLRAEKDHRSLAQEAVVLLSEALKVRGHDSTRRLAALKNIQILNVETTSKNLDVVALMLEDRKR